MNDTEDSFQPESDVKGSQHQRWTSWLAIGSLAVIVALLVLVPGLRSLPRDTWREIRDMNPVFLGAIIGLKVLQALLSALTWRNALRSAWPKADVPYGFVLGVDAGQDVVNTFSPARAGTWAMLGVFTYSIPGARVSTMMAVWAVQSLAFWFFAVVNYALIAIGLPQRTQTGQTWTQRAKDLATDRPWLFAAACLACIVALSVVVLIGRRRLADFRRHVAEGFSILREPKRFLYLIFAPSAAAYAARALSCALLLAAFDIPVTLWTVVLSLGSRAAAGAVRVAPGGVGTTQALEVVALRDYASTETVVAYSLVDLALTTLVNLGLAVPALLTARGWHGTRSIMSGANPEQPARS